VYYINHIKDLNILEIQNSSNNSNAKIHLSAGGSLQELTLNTHSIICDLSPLSYDNTYASSILFPFANRIKDGIYSYNGIDFQFKINQKEEKNALHGLVYNKSFELIEQIATEDEATVLLKYNEINLVKGFPYTYTIYIEYKFTNRNLRVRVEVKNTFTEAFPFTIGWHPYFTSDDLKTSSLDFESNQQLIIGERNITTGIKDIEPIDNFSFEEKKLDDCWVLTSKTLQFNTPKYKMRMESSSENNFLQLYTPPKENVVAIEPTTGVSDSFNNKIGLQTLKAGETYSITWNLKILNN
jgi:aldose 1-epimerase